MQGDSAISEDQYVEIDAGIKTILALLLAVAVSLCHNRLDLLYFTLYLVVITALLGSDLQFILKNLVAYGIFIIFPYLCGLLFSLLMSKLFAGPTYVHNFDATFLRMVKIFFIWYIGSLYFFTTPLKIIMDLFNKVFSPLNSLGIPVEKRLNMAMVVINELTKSVSQFKQDIMEKARCVFKNKDLGFKAKLKEFSGILVAFIANSLQQTDEIQKQIELTRALDYQYKLRISKNEIFAILSFIIFSSVFLV